MFNFVVLYSLIVAMSPRRPSGSDKGKKKTKPRRQPPGYIIRVLGQIPQSAPIQAPLLAGVPTPHPAGVPTPHHLHPFCHHTLL